MKLALIILLSLGDARKEALKRWPDKQWSLRTDVTTTKTVYELSVMVKRMSKHPFRLNPECRAEVLSFSGANWQAVMDQSKGIVSDCTNPVNVRK